MLLTSKILHDIGFRYDIEDNLWYDEHKQRHRYGFRIGCLGSNYYELFYGGYGTCLGKHKTVKELGVAMFKYKKSLVGCKFVWKL